MQVLSLFSGAGGLDLGIIMAGNKVVWANDIDPDAVETYRKNIGDNIVCDDKYGDEHINEILYKALQNPQNVFYFFQYGETIGCNFIDDMIRLSESMPNINVISGKILASFDWFVKFLLPATPEKSDEERALELCELEVD